MPRRACSRVGSSGGGGGAKARMLSSRLIGRRRRGQGPHALESAHRGAAAVPRRACSRVGSSGGGGGAKARMPSCRLIGGAAAGPRRACYRVGSSYLQVAWRRMQERWSRGGWLLSVERSTGGGSLKSRITAQRAPGPSKRPFRGAIEVGWPPHPRREMAKSRCTGGSATRNQKNRCQRQRWRCPDLNNFIAIDLEWSATKALTSEKFTRQIPP